MSKNLQLHQVISTGLSMKTRAEEVMDQARYKIAMRKRINMAVLELVTMLTHIKLTTSRSKTDSLVETQKTFKWVFKIFISRIIIFKIPNRLRIPITSMPIIQRMATKETCTSLTALRICMASETIVSTVERVNTSHLYLVNKETAQVEHIMIILTSSIRIKITNSIIIIWDLVEIIVSEETHFTSAITNYRNKAENSTTSPWEEGTEGLWITQPTITIWKCQRLKEITRMTSHAILLSQEQYRGRLTHI